MSTWWGPGSSLPSLQSQKSSLTFVNGINFESLHWKFNESYLIADASIFAVLKWKKGAYSLKPLGDNPRMDGFCANTPTTSKNPTTVVIFSIFRFHHVAIEKSRDFRSRKKQRMNGGTYFNVSLVGFALSVSSILRNMEFPNPDERSSYQLFLQTVVESKFHSLVRYSQILFYLLYRCSLISVIAYWFKSV